MQTETRIVLTADARGVQAGARQAVASLNDVEKALGSIQALSAKALSFAGLGFGGKELIALADQYGALTARLQLATQFTGDFSQVMAALRRTADDTRAPLKDTVELYTKLSPSLQALGRSGAQSVSVIATVNKAIALSGASSEAASASMTQFSQALGSGVLRGDELNSILEQTPTLADAIAEGLGVARGELRKMGEDGKLSSLVVLQALEKVSDRIDRDFAKMPTTVGQALTYLLNTLTDVVGSTGQSSGAMAALASAIKIVADGFKDFSAASSGIMIPAIALIIDTVDGAARVFRTLGITIAAMAARFVETFKGNFDVAGQIRDEANTQIEAIWAEPQWKDKYKQAIVATEKDVADQRLKLQKNLAAEQQKLEDLKTFAAGKASAAILKDDKARIDEQIKDAERLRDALARAWEDTRKGIEAARKEADDLLHKAADVRQAAADKIADRQNKNLTPEQQDANTFSDFQQAASAAAFNQALAKAAGIDGRIEVAKRAAEKAARDTERAVRLADKLKNDDLAVKAIGEAADLQARLLEAQAEAKQKESSDLEAKAQQQADTLRNLEASLDALRQKAATLQVQADVTQAEARIAGLKAQLDALTDKTVTVTVNTVAAGQAGSAPAPGFAAGGYTGPGAKFTPAGIVHAGEFVVRREVVNLPGVMAMLARLNRDGVASLKGYASGGLVGRLGVPALPASRGSTPTPVNLHLDGRRYPMSAAPDVVAEMTAALGREALKRGARR